MTDPTPLFTPPPGPDDPLGMLRACHRRLEARLDTLGHVADLLAGAPGTRLEAAAGAIARAISHLDGAARLHVEDEEVSLFPRLQAADPGATAVIAGLATDHAEIEAGWRALRAVLEAIFAALEVGRAPEPVLVDRLRALLPPFAAAHQGHHAREERELLPRAEALLDARALAELADEMQARRQGEGDRAFSGPS